MPAILAGSAAGPTITKSLYITSRRSRACRSATNCVLRLAGVDQQDVGVAAASDLERLAGAHGDDLDATAALLLEAGRMAFSNPESSVLVVVARRRTGGPAGVTGASGQHEHEGDNGPYGGME